MSAIENRVALKLLARAQLGLSKYGTTMERTDLSRADWLRHAQEEALDLAVYLERLLNDEAASASASNVGRLAPAAGRALADSDRVRGGGAGGDGVEAGSPAWEE
jgi:hypothetical protein